MLPILMTIPVSYLIFIISGGVNGLILATCNDTVGYHSAMLEHAFCTRVAVAGATVGAAMMEVTAAVFC